MTDEPTPACQPDDASVKLAGSALAGVLALIPLAALFVGALLWMFEAHAPSTPVSPLQRELMTPPPPRLQTAPRQDRIALEQRAEARLQAYGWADKSAGSARIPIERSMALLAQQGWPDAPEPAP